MKTEATFLQDAIDESKVELVKRKKRKKMLLWTSFLLFGWSYGSLGKPGIQLAWYAILIFSVYNLWDTYTKGLFDAYSAIAVMGAIVMVFWFLARMITLNHAIRRFNNELADFYYLTSEERAEAGID